MTPKRSLTIACMALLALSLTGQTVQAEEDCVLTIEGSPPGLEGGPSFPNQRALGPDVCPAGPVASGADDEAVTCDNTYAEVEPYRDDNLNLVVNGIAQVRCDSSEYSHMD